MVAHKAGISRRISLEESIDIFIRFLATIIPGCVSYFNADNKSLILVTTWSRPGHQLLAKQNVTRESEP